MIVSQSQSQQGQGQPDIAPKQTLINPTSPSFILMVLVSITLISLILAGVWVMRGDWIYPTQPQATAPVPHLIFGETTVGQTFIPRQAGLQGVGLKVHVPSPHVPQDLTLKVYSGPDQRELLRSATVSPGPLTDGQYLYFSFAPLTDSRGQAYYLALQSSLSQPEGAIALLSGPLNVYIDGSSYHNNEPYDANLGFHLNYHRPSMLGDWGQRILFSLPTSLATIIFLLLPGATVLAWLNLKTDLDPLENLALMVALSLAIYPLVIMLLHYTPISLSIPIVWALALLCAVSLVISGWQQGWLRDGRLKSAAGELLQKPHFIAFFFILGISLVIRLLIIEGVAAPLWADGYHHTILTSLIIDNGGLGSDWLPYVPLQTINYHFGFHAMAAFFHWFTTYTPIDSVLYFGQIANAMAVLMAYLMGRRFSQQAWVGVIAALLTGLLLNFPIFYTNWGRYTQLVGQLILPGLMVTTLLLLQHPKKSWGLVALNTLLLAGLALTHYRVILYYPCFVLPLLAIRWGQAGFQRRALLEDVLRLAAIGGLALVLISPRLIEVVGGKLWNMNVTIAQNGRTSTRIQEGHNAMQKMGDYLPVWVIYTGWAGLALSVWRRKFAVTAVGIWWGILLLITNPHWFYLPGSGVITNFAIFIALYMIFSVLVGYLLGEGLTFLSEQQAWVGWAAIPVIVALGFWGAGDRLNVLESARMIVTPPDLQAMTWIKENTPAEASFLVNGRLGYNGRLVAGTDAGWWLPYLAERDNIAPPMIYVMESPVEADYAQTVYETYEQLRNPTLTVEDMAAQMTAYNLDYIYIGQQRGAVWEGDEPPFDPTVLAASSAFELVYAQDGVRIFHLNDMQVQ